MHDGVSAPSGCTTPPRAASAFLCINVFLPIVVGASIYTLWRSKALLVFGWYHWAGIDAPLLSLRTYVAPIRHLIPSEILYSLPDALWVYSFTALLLCFWEEQKRSIERAFWIFLPVSLAEGSEIGQFFGIVPGTFDPVDLLAYFLAFAAASISVYLFVGRSTAT